MGFFGWGRGACCCRLLTETENVRLKEKAQQLRSHLCSKRGPSVGVVWSKDSKLNKCLFFMRSHFEILRRSHMSNLEVTEVFDGPIINFRVPKIVDSDIRLRKKKRMVVVFYS